MTYTMSYACCHLGCCLPTLSVDTKFGRSRQGSAAWRGV